MRNKLEAALDAVRAEPELKESVARYVAQRAQVRQGHRTRWAALAAACLLTLVLGLGGFSVYFTPTATIHFTINPAVELKVNRFDRVIGASGLNEDGQRLLTSLELRHLNYLDAIDTLLESETVSQLLAQDRPASIDISSGDLARQDTMVEAVSTCTAGYKSVHCSGGHGQGAGHHRSDPAPAPTGGHNRHRHHAGG